MMLMEADSINWNAVNGIGAMLGLAVALVIAFSKRSQERIVTVNPDMATKHEVREAREAVEAHKAEVAGQMRRVHERIERVQEEIHKQLGDVGREVSAIGASTELQNQSLAEIRADVKRIAERRHA